MKLVVNKKVEISDHESLWLVDDFKSSGLKRVGSTVQNLFYVAGNKKRPVAVMSPTSLDNAIVGVESDGEGFIVHDYRGYTFSLERPFRTAKVRPEYTR